MSTVDNLDNEKRIKLNIGGTLFETTYGTISQSEYLKKLVEWNKDKLNEPIFINRIGEHFKHVLALLIDGNHSFPRNLQYELDFYCIKYLVKTDQKESMENQFISLENEIRLLKSQFNSLKSELVSKFKSKKSCGKYSNKHD